MKSLLKALGIYGSYLAYGTVALAMIISIMITDNHITTTVNQQYNQQIDFSLVEIDNSIRKIKAMLKVDSVRIEAMNKVEKIINIYNPTMSDLLKKQIGNTIYNASIKYDNLNVDLVCATITHESALSWDPKVVSYMGAIGLMQVMPRTGRFVAETISDIEWDGTETLFDPIFNIRIGTKYLNDLIEILEDTEAGLAAYNGGERRARQWLLHKRNNQYLAAETREYIPRVMRYYAEYSGQPQYLTYTIKRGDFLSKIADKYQLSIEEVINMNNHIDDPDQLEIDMVIRLPLASNERI